MKAVFHKSCSCEQCKLGRATKSGHATKKANEKKLRRIAKLALQEVVKGNEQDVVVAPISSPYTD